MATLEPGWAAVLEKEFESLHMIQLKAFLLEEKARNARVFPKNSEIFAALNLTPFDKVKVVILGQDPYHGPDQAHGLSFSVKRGVPIPPSLRNIFKEMETDVPGFSAPAHGDLTKWAEQGVLLLNATLTVRSGEAGSHQKKGWEIFTDNIIKAISTRHSGVIFILWGKYARDKSVLIDERKHHVLTSAHPSPLSAYNGFFGSAPFSKANQLLIQENKQRIDWLL